MEVKFNVSKEERKTLVKAVSEITGQEAVYKGAPGFAFAVGGYVIDRFGTLICGEETDAEETRTLLTELQARSFTVVSVYGGVLPAEPDNSAAGDGESEQPGSNESEPDAGEHSGEVISADPGDGSGRLVIHVPLFTLTASAIDNIEKLVAAKAWILKKMAGTDALPIERDEKHLRFPWFKPDASPTEVDAYSRLIARLCETAKEKKRVSASERQLEDGDNEKFKARCFLLSLGFIGPEYSQARKILLAPMSGNGSHKSGNSKKTTAPAAETPADSGGTSADTGAHSDCLACANSLSEPGENDGDPDRLFCVVKQIYVGEDGSCDDFNS